MNLSLLCRIRVPSSPRDRTFERDIPPLKASLSAVRAFGTEWCVFHNRIS